MRLCFIDCDSAWPAFNGWIAFWPPYCIINCWPVIVLIVILENKLSSFTLEDSLTTKNNPRCA